MSEWRTFRLGDISDMKYGKIPKKDDIVDNGYPIFTGYRVAGFHKSYLYKNPELIVVCRGVGGTGDVKISPPKSYITNLSIVVKLDDSIANKKFVYYLYQRRNLRYLDTGSAQSQITISDLENIEITLPSAGEQENIAQTLFKRWFIDFEFPDKDGKPYKSSGGKMVESELGEIPEGWQVGTTKDFGKIVCGKTPPKKIMNFTVEMYRLLKYQICTIQCLLSRQKIVCRKKVLIFKSIN